MEISCHPIGDRLLLCCQRYRIHPLSSSLQTELRCDACFSSANINKCSGCQVVWYCGSTCQKFEWKLHRLECIALSKLDKERRKSVTPSIRLMVRLYLRRKLQNDKVIPVTPTDNYNLVQALVAHMKDIDEKQLLLYAQPCQLDSSVA
ncbi:Histone-lysine N-methyltransferase ASHR1 [Euphorbia peplus]|nr:Histone-lysine N-methyltransferase ASHR1 [Euphorbia peplus]